MKKLFTLKDSWPWALITLFSIIITPLAIMHNWNDQNIVKLCILIVVDFAFYSIIFWRYDLREQFINIWNKAYHTRTNVAIIANNVGFKLINAGLYQNSTWDTISNEIDKCVDYWANWDQNRISSPNIIVVPGGMGLQTRKTKQNNVLYGATLNIVSNPPTVNFIGKVMGYEDGQNIVVTFDGDKVKTLEQLLALIRHEVSHICLSALGVDSGYAGANHHIIFNQTGFC